MRLLHFYILSLLGFLLLPSCGKNEFTLSGSLSDSRGKTLRVIYRAADKKRSFIEDNPVPLEADGAFSMKGIVVFPTVLWVTDMQTGELLLPIYAERGDELTLSGKYSEPWGWTVNGNKVMERYSEWAKANAPALKSGNTAKINAAIAGYVSENPDSRTAAFLLLTRFDIRDHEAQYKSLLAKLDMDEDDLKEMQEACMAVQTASVPQVPKKFSMRLPGTADSLMNVDIAGASRTLVYFWNDSPTGEESSLIESLDADTARRCVSIFMDSDTVRWHNIIKNDKALKTTLPYRALGAEANPQVKAMGVTRTPYMIVVDSAGKILYHGSGAAEARSSLFK